MFKPTHKKLGIICSILLVLTFILTSDSINNSYKSSNSEVSTQAVFENFTDTLFKENVVSNTINLHYTLENPQNYGITKYPITFGSFSHDSMLNSYDKIQEYINCLSGIDYESLTYDQQVTYDILNEYFNRELEGKDFIYYTEVLSPTIGTQAQLPVLLAEYKFNTEKDVVEYLELLTKLDDYYNNIIEFEEEKADKGLFMAECVADEIIKQCEDFTLEPENNYLISIFDNKIDSLSFLNDTSKANYKLQNKSILYSEVIPAYNKLSNSLEFLKSSSENQMGLCKFPLGKQYYEHLVKASSGSSRSIAEIKKLLNNYLKSNLNEMALIAAKDPTILTLSEIDSLSVSKPENILSDLRAKINEDFPSLEETNFTVKYVHESLAPHLSPAFYLTPPLDNINDNCIYINPKTNYNKIDLFTTLAHEGYPGHLYQNVYFNSAKLSPIRYLLSFGGYSEGWATYVEMYSYSLTGLSPDLSQFLRLNNAITLYLYATMDIGIHYDGWTMHNVFEYLSGFGFDNYDTAKEIYTAILGEPANYLKYCLGYLEFMELKKEASTSLNENFNTKQFHKFILDTGPAPFEVIQKYMEQWILSTKHKS